MDIGRGVLYRERNACRVYHEMALGTLFAAIGRIRPGLFAPPGADTAAESSEARDQSMRPASPKRSSSTLWSRFQTPASCHSLSRRQQVIPDPQPISLGSISQGMPDLSTNTMPLSAARSSMRGRPPFGLGGSFGKSGSTTTHSSSVTSGFGMVPSIPDRGSCWTHSENQRGKTLDSTANSCQCVLI
jgi:hypothetical protein